MSNNHKIIHWKKSCLLLCASIVILFTGCKKWLDVQPVDKVPEKILLSTEQGYKDALLGVYLSMDKSSAGGSSNIYTSHLSLGLLSVLAYAYDNGNLSNAGGNPTLYNAAYNYNYNDATLKAEMANVWNVLYNNIGNLNNLLKQIDANKAVFTGNNYQLIKGEALGLRALFHLDAVRLFGKPPLVAGATPAVPYVTTFSIHETPLSSVNDALEFCLNDLRASKSLLATTDTSTVLSAAVDPFISYTQNHCNYWAVQGMMARAFLYKGNTDSADYYAQTVINSGKFPLSKTNVAFSGNIIRDRTFSKEHLFSVYTSNLVGINNTVLNGAGALLLSITGRNNLYATPTTDNTDWRLQSWFDNGTSGVVPSKFMQDANLPYALQGLMPVIRVTEMYYIASECANTKGNISNGLYFLNQVRGARGLTAIKSTTVTQDSLYTAITSEYKKEFISEGQTFFYYKRRNMNLTAAAGTPVAIPTDVYVFPLPDAEKQYR